ncbi:MAG: hypothetical protein HYS05_18005 [Acidobacteria bacterium]|nr:hypothetical protein [Acidobacteriota bacterium]
MIPGKTYTPDDILRAAWRRRWWIAIPTVIVSIGAVISSLLAPERYQAEALVQVLPPAVPDAVVQSTVGSRFRMEERLPTIQRAILTRPRLQKIIEDFNLYEKMRRSTVMENVLEQMGKDTVFTIVDQEIFRVGYIAGTPQLAYDVSKRLTALFLEESTRDREGLAEATQDFLQTQLDDAKRRLLEQERKLQEYQTQYGGELPEQQAANLQVLNSTQLQVQQLAEALNRDRNDRLFLQRQLERAMTDDPAVATALAPGAPKSLAELGTPAQQLDAARAELRAIELKLTPEHPDILQAKRNIEKLEQKVRSDARAGGKPGRTLTAAEALKESRIADLQGQFELADRQIANKLAEQGRLQSTIGEYRRRLEAVPLRESEMTALTRDYKTIQELYNSLLQKREGAKIAANLERGAIGERFKVLDPGRVPEKRISPKRTQMCLVGLGMGLLLGLAIGGLVEFRDSALRTDEDVEASLGLPVLAIVPTVGAASAVGVTVGAIDQRDTNLLRLAAMMVAGAAVTSFAASLIWMWMQGR